MRIEVSEWGEEGTEAACHDPRSQRKSPERCDAGHLAGARSLGSQPSFQETLESSSLHWPGMSREHIHLDGEQSVALDLSFQANRANCVHLHQKWKFYMTTKKKKTKTPGTWMIFW